MNCSTSECMRNESLTHWFMEFYNSLGVGTMVFKKHEICANKKMQFFSVCIARIDFQSPQIKIAFHFKTAHKSRKIWFIYINLSCIKGSQKHTIIQAHCTRKRRDIHDRCLIGISMADNEMGFVSWMKHMKHDDIVHFNWILISVHTSSVSTTTKSHSQLNSLIR